jgi:hypothetical protein
VRLQLFRCEMIPIDPAKPHQANLFDLLSPHFIVGGNNVEHDKKKKLRVHLEAKELTREPEKIPPVSHIDGITIIGRDSNC